jgi:hypothetical protein
MQKREEEDVLESPYFLQGHSFSDQETSHQAPSLLCVLAMPHTMAKMCCLATGPKTTGTFKTASQNKAFLLIS